MIPAAPEVVELRSAEPMQCTDGRGGPLGQLCDQVGNATQLLGQSLNSLDGFGLSGHLNPKIGEVVIKVSPTRFEILTRAFK